MRQGITIVLLLLFAVPAAALQIGDGYNNDTYNGHAYSQSDNAFLTMQAKSSGVPVGTIISWPLGENPEDAENWLECDGRAVPSNYELAKFMTHTPDYRGQFLRGVGGKAGALGAVQKESVYVPKSSAGVFTMNNVGLGFVVSCTTSESYGANDSAEWTVRNTSCGKHNAVTSYFYNSSSLTGRRDYLSGGGNILFKNSGGSIDLPIEIKTGDTETRPENRAVRYLIRAQ